MYSENFGKEVWMRFKSGFEGVKFLLLGMGIAGVVFLIIHNVIIKIGKNTELSNEFITLVGSGVLKITGIIVIGIAGFIMIICTIRGIKCAWEYIKEYMNDKF